MCGIVGILGKGAVATDLVDALRRLEYRGYDSAGVATVENGHLDRRRADILEDLTVLPPAATGVLGQTISVRNPG